MLPIMLNTLCQDIYRRIRSIKSSPSSFCYLIEELINIDILIYKPKFKVNP